MSLPPSTTRPALYAAGSVLVSALFAGLALLRDGVGGGVRTLWWAISVLWLLVAAHHLRRTLAARSATPAELPDATDEAVSEG